MSEPTDCKPSTEAHESILKPDPNSSLNSSEGKPAWQRYLPRLTKNEKNADSNTSTLVINDNIQPQVKPRLSSNRFGPYSARSLNKEKRVKRAEFWSPYITRSLRGKSNSCNPSPSIKLGLDGDIDSALDMLDELTVNKVHIDS